MKHSLAIVTGMTLSLALLPACDKKQPAASSTTPKAEDHHGHTHGPGGEHVDPQGHAGHGGAVIELGSKTSGVFELKATRDEGPIVAGKDAPVDVTVTPSAGSAAKAAAVRFWIGTEDARGSVKAKAQIENPAEPNRWHTHVEVPSPVPAGSMLWVEIEDDKGEKLVVPFDLKA
jgi:hypothetical protein